jgi:hypothetical protein
MLYPPVVGHCRIWCILLNPACCHPAQPSRKARLIVRLPDQPPTIAEFGSCMSNATELVIDVGGYMGVNFQITALARNAGIVVGVSNLTCTS